jgi:hypothetical protein
MLVFCLSARGLSLLRACHSWADVISHFELALGISEVDDEDEALLRTCAQPSRPMHTRAPLCVGYSRMIICIGPVPSGAAYADEGNAGLVAFFCCICGS